MNCNPRTGDDILPGGENPIGFSGIPRSMRFPEGLLSAPNRTAVSDDARPLNFVTNPLTEQRSK
jgi:hypothetical protein